MTRRVPDGWRKVDEKDLQAWLSTSAPDYKMDGWSGVIFYKRRHDGVDMAAVTDGGEAFVNPVFLQ